MLFNWLKKKGLLAAGSRNLDWGSGPYDTATTLLQELGVANLTYDPYHLTKEHNHNVFEQAFEDPVDTVTLSNVLNVLPSNVDRYLTLMMADSLLKDTGTIYISIYEGNRTGQGCTTGEDQWQENRKAEAYIDELRWAFSNRQITRSGKVITIRRDPIRAKTFINLCV